jgi:hypothetical protein
MAALACAAPCCASPPVLRRRSRFLIFAAGDDNLPSDRGRSSVGRAPQSHCGGQGFKSPRLHQAKLRCGWSSSAQHALSGTNCSMIRCRSSGPALLRRTYQHLGGDAELLVQPPDHGNRQTSPAVQHFRHARPRADEWLEVLAGQPLLLHAKLDGCNRVRIMSSSCRGCSSRATSALHLALKRARSTAKRSGGDRDPHPARVLTTLADLPLSGGGEARLPHC